MFTYSFVIITVLCVTVVKVYLFVPDNEPYGLKHVALYKEKLCFYNKERCVEYNCIYYLVCETQWNVFSKGHLPSY